MCGIEHPPSHLLGIPLKHPAMLINISQENIKIASEYLFERHRIICGLENWPKKKNRQKYYATIKGLDTEWLGVYKVTWTNQALTSQARQKRGDLRLQIRLLVNA